MKRGEVGKRTLELSQQKTKRVVRNTCGEGEKERVKTGWKSNGVVLRACSEDIMKVS